jgi:hypothetical protein
LTSRTDEFIDCEMIKNKSLLLEYGFLKEDNSSFGFTEKGNKISNIL